MKFDEKLEDYLNIKAKQISQHNIKVGWWDLGEKRAKTAIQLISTEIAEATEGVRKNLMDDKLPHRKMEEVELADVLIRLLDFGGYFDLNLEFIYNVESISCSRLNNLKESKNEFPIDCHYYLNKDLFEFSDSFFENYNSELDYRLFCLIGRYTRLIVLIFEIAEIFNYDLISAMEEKIQFNKIRADHKKENRQKEGGKKF